MEEDPRTTAKTALLFRDDAYLRTATAQVVAVQERGIELDRTIFYPQGGGQAGDTGALVREGGEPLALVDTRKGDAPDSVPRFRSEGRRNRRVEIALA